MLDVPNTLFAALLISATLGTGAAVALELMRPTVLPVLIIFVACIGLLALLGN